MKKVVLVKGSAGYSHESTCEGLYVDGVLVATEPSSTAGMHASQALGALESELRFAFKVVRLRNNVDEMPEAIEDLNLY